MIVLKSVERVVSDGYHNAFTDLMKWRGYYYLTFRKAEHHGFPPDGDAIVMRSADLNTWEYCACLSTEGDDRDPKLINAGGQLGVVFGTWFPRWRAKSLHNQEADLVSHMCLSRDGLCWSAPRQIYGINYWLWRVFASAEEGYFCAAYHFPQRSDRLMRSVHLLRSEDLLSWTLVGQIREGGGCGEPVLFQPSPGVLHCVIRTLTPDHHSWLGKSTAPYTEWEWTDLGVMVHAPVVLDVDGDWILAGRSQPSDLPPGTCEPESGAHTSIWRIGPDDKAEHLLTLPSAGDCSYCGLAHGLHGDVLVSYYSQHDHQPLPQGQPTPADIYLTRLGMR